jgi:hypothetical protein
MKYHHAPPEKCVACSRLGRTSWCSRDTIYSSLRFHPDLYCSGHTHGGQIALPLYGALVVLSDCGKRFEAGLYRVRGTWLYVNRGIGMEGGPVLRVRFWSRPEVTVYELVPAM